MAPISQSKLGDTKQYTHYLGTEKIDSSIQIIDAETLEPVGGGIQVHLGLLGELGGDGGFDVYETDHLGFVYFDYVGPAMFLVALIPAEDSPYTETTYYERKSMLKIASEGIYFPKQFRILRK